MDTVIRKFLMASRGAAAAGFCLDKLDRNSPAPKRRLVPYQFGPGAYMFIVACKAGPPVDFLIDVQVVQVKSAVTKIGKRFGIALFGDRLFVAEKA